MRGNVSRGWGAKVAGFLVAFGLMVTGISVPASAGAATGEPTPPEEGITVTPSRDRWWYGQAVSFDVEVVRDGQPASGYVRLVRDASGGMISRVRLTDGRATLRPETLGPSGAWTLSFIHESIDPETSQWTIHFSTSLDVLVEQPATPVLSPTSWYAGASQPLRFDLTGTDEPQVGTIEFDYPFGVTHQAELVDGVATFPHDATRQFPAGWRVITFRHREAPTGDLVAEWALSATVYRKPVELAVTMPSTWQYGKTVSIPVSVVSRLGGVPEGVVNVSSSGRRLASANLIDGRATVTVPATRLPIGRQTVGVSFVPSTDEFARASHKATVTVTRRPTTVSVRTGDVWTYAKPRRVSVTVTAAGATPTGGVELYWGGTSTRIGTGTLVDGKVSIVVKGKKVYAGRPRIVAKYLGTPTLAPSRHAWSQRIRKAQPTVRLSLSETRIRVSRSTQHLYATVTVSTPNMPEVGHLCLRLREPSAEDRWLPCLYPMTVLGPGDDGKKRIRLSGDMIRADNNWTGPVYVKFVYHPRSPNVRTMASNAVRVVRYS